MESAVEDGDGVPGEVDPVSMDGGGLVGPVIGIQQADRRRVTGEWPAGER
jgi:hypothetical protein